MSSRLIEPKILKGFQDTLPATGLKRLSMVHLIEEVFLSFGFSPIDTPALEYAEILLGKGSDETDRQMYRFTDNGGREVALRFDLTVPLARFVAMHVNELPFPFKRFHIAPVWRAEKPQRGRYREFIQCDFDTIGSDSPVADAEIVAVIHQALKRIGISHQVRINNRKILNGLLDNLQAREHSTSVLRAIDKLDKLGEETVRKELKEEANLSEAQIGQVFEYMRLSKTPQPKAELTSELRKFLKESELGLKGVSDLESVVRNAELFGVDAESISIDLTIARGLDYYTGSVFETKLVDLPGIGSICSGGRYDDLASLYINRRLPGVGASIGLDRILGALEELGRLEQVSSPAQVLVTLLDESARDAAFRVVAKIREAEISAEVALEPSQLGGQLKYADRKGIPFALILGEREVKEGKCSLKNLKEKSQEDGIALNDIPQRLKSILGKNLSS